MRQKRLNTQANYRKTDSFANRVIVPSLTGDGRLESKVHNYMALENRIVGWIMAQPWYAEYEQWIIDNKMRDDVSLHAGDLAVEVASDIAVRNPSYFRQE